MTFKLDTSGLVALVLMLVSSARPQATVPAGHDVISYSHATVVGGCDKGTLVLEIFFTTTELSASGAANPPFLRLELPASATEAIPPGTYTLETPPPGAKPASQARTGRAAFVAAGQAPVWLSGTFMINSMIPGRYLNGHFRVEMPDGRIAESGFLARYLPGHPACGV